MMPDTYAIIEESTGLVVNVMLWDGQTEYPVEEGFSLVKSDSAVIGGTYKDGEFTLPEPPPVPVPTPEEILAANTQMQASLQAAASQAMTPLLVSLQLGDATDEETASAKAWQAYTRALKVVDLTAIKPAWPKVPA